jgi:hypothetical protein
MADDLAPDVGHQGEPGDKVPVRAEFVDQYRLGCRFPGQVGPVEGSLMDGANGVEIGRGLPSDQHERQGGPRSAVVSVI